MKLNVYWFCEECQQIYKSKHDESDVMSVYEGIGVDHRRISPHCEARTLSLRIINFRGMLAPDLPCWVLEPILELINVAEL